MMTRDETIKLLRGFNSTQRAIAYVILSLALPAAVISAVASRLYSEIKSAFWYAWRDGAEEMDTFKLYWNALSRKGQTQ